MRICSLACLCVLALSVGARAQAPAEGDRPREAGEEIAAPEGEPAEADPAGPASTDGEEPVAEAETEDGDEGSSAEAAASATLTPAGTVELVELPVDELREEPGANAEPRLSPRPRDALSDSEPVEPAGQLDSPLSGPSDEEDSGERAPPQSLWRLAVVGEVTGLAGFFVGALVGCFFGSGGNSLSGDACRTGLTVGAGIGTTAAITAGVYGAGTHGGAPGSLGYTLVGTTIGVAGAYGFHLMSVALDAEALAVAGWLTMPIVGGISGFALSRDESDRSELSAAAGPIAGGAMLSLGGRL